MDKGPNISSIIRLAMAKVLFVSKYFEDPVKTPTYLKLWQCVLDLFLSMFEHIISKQPQVHITSICKSFIYHKNTTVH